MKRRTPKGMVEDLELTSKILNGVVTDVHNLTQDLDLDGKETARLLMSIRKFRAECVTQILGGKITMG